MGSSWRFDTPHSSFSGSSRAMGILCPIVQPPVLSVLYSWCQVLLCCSVAPHLIGDDPRSKSGALEQFAKKLLRCDLIATALHENINHLTLSIDRSPQVKMLSFDGDHHFVKVPLIHRDPASFTNLIGIVLRKPLAPIADRFVGHLNTAIEHHLLDVAVAQGEGVARHSGE